jgi:hypothetical protein
MEILQLLCSYHWPLANTQQLTTSVRVSSSWRQAPWDSRPEFFQLNTCGNSPYVTSSVTRRWVPTTSSHSQSHIATDGQSISKPWCRAPSGAHDQILITLWHLRSCFCWVPSLTRGRACLLYMLLSLANVVFFGPESFGTRDHILLSQIWDFPFRRLLRLTGSRWRYSTPPHSFQLSFLNDIGTARVENTVSNSSSIVACGLVALGTCVFEKALLCNGCVYLFNKNLLPSNEQ